MIVPQYDLRFVKREIQVGPIQDKGSHSPKTINILQWRRQELDVEGSVGYTWTDWEDVRSEDSV